MILHNLISTDELLRTPFVKSAVGMVNMFLNALFVTWISNSNFHKLFKKCVVCSSKYVQADIYWPKSGHGSVIHSSKSVKHGCPLKGDRLVNIPHVGSLSSWCQWMTRTSVRIFRKPCTVVIQNIESDRDTWSSRQVYCFRK